MSEYWQGFFAGILVTCVVIGLLWMGAGVFDALTS